jgi:N-methylhydantoinase A
MGVRVGIDTGGTFTDFVAIDEQTGAVRRAKVPSTPGQPELAVRAGMDALTAAGAADVERVVVGTTVATNALIERRGPHVVYVTNAGFEDVPFIGRIDKARLYDLHWQKPRPLVERQRCLGVPGRVDHHGAELEQLDDASLSMLRDRLVRLGGGEVVVAVCLLFSYLRPDHERAVGQAVREALPAAQVSLSHEVSPVWREYERASTTIADAFVKPVISTYIDGVGSALSESAARVTWSLLASNGGHLSAAEAGSNPAQLLVSGLAGGVIGAAHFARTCGHDSVFSLDMGGTSSDIGVITRGEQQYARDFELAFGVPVTVPCVDVRTIGAGGGSIAAVDRGGMLHVGPRSAGAEPGPVAYGTGGSEPTVTDANLVLGRIDPDYFLGGAMQLDREAAELALARLGSEIGRSASDAALAVVATADENMANAIRLMSVERGLDPREMALVAIGGAGPLHARAVAALLGMRTVLVPPSPGLCSAFGAAIADARVDRVQTYYTHSGAADIDALGRRASALVENARDALARTAGPDRPATIRRVAEMRYAGQNYELEVDLPDGALDEQGFAALLEGFAAAHLRQYGFALPGEAVEIINLRVTASAAETPPATAFAGSAGAERDSRRVAFDGDGPIDCPVRRRESLSVGELLHGPMIVEEADSTTMIPPGDSARVLADGVLEIALGGAR